MTQLTPRQKQAVDWVKSHYGRQWHKRLSTRPESLPIGYRHLWYYPFGILEWNENIRIARRVFYQGKV